VLLRSDPAAELGPGVSDVVIAEAETRLQVSIAGAYRWFLSDFGWGRAQDLEIFGLGDAVPGHLDLLVLTTSERVEMHPQLPDHLLPLANSGAGDLYCLDTRVDGEPPIVVWDHTQGVDQVPDGEAASFTVWVAGWLKPA